MFKAAVAFLVIPVIGYFTASYVIDMLDSNSNYSLAQICSMNTGELKRIFLSDANAIRAGCSELIEPVLLLYKASAISIIASVAILFVFKISTSYCGTDRDKNAFIFPKLVPVTVLIIAAQVLVQGLILAYLSYLIPAEILDSGIYFPAVTFFIAGGAAVGFFQVSSSLLSLFKKPEHIERAILIERDGYPKLWNHVEAIAEKIEAKKPDNIVIGLQPTFYATTANVKLIGNEDILNGETLYLSLPLMKLFTREELDAVVGHELGHFKAKDTNYSTKFAPVYVNLGSSLSNLANTSGSITALAKLPAIFVLSAMYEAFETNIAAISRDREFEADKVGCEASSKEGLVYSLAKVVTYSNLWNQTILDNVKRLNNGKITTNLSEVFRESSTYNIGKKDIDDIVAEVLPSIIQHPTDSHPPLVDRYKSIDFNVDSITRDKIIHQGNAVEKLIDNAKTLEEDLTMDEHNFEVAMGWAIVPEEETVSDMANIIYSMAAAMIGADGKLENDEIRVAEELGSQILEDFDRIDFRNFVDNLDKIPDFNSTAKICAEFDDDNRAVIYNYLEAIAHADDELADDEKVLLDGLKEMWSLLD